MIAISRCVKMGALCCLLIAPNAAAAQDDNVSPPEMDATFARPAANPLFADSAPGLGSNEPPETVTITYFIKRPVHEHTMIGDTSQRQTRYVFETRSAKIKVDDDLHQLDLPPDGKRTAVLAVTAARHDALLENLKNAKTEEEKTKATEALKENYTEHYAIETWWREQKLAELEKRLNTMRQQVQERQDAQEKYVDAAMTIAELWSKGIAIAPPKPSPGTSASPAMPLTPAVAPGGRGVAFPAASFPPSLSPPAPSVPDAFHSDQPRMQ